MDTESVINFIKDHSVWFAFVLGYVLLNVMKRVPPPKHPVLLWFWKVVEYACFLGWTKWGGPLKGLFTMTHVEAPSDESTK